jgi:hypothetical protein
MPEESTPPRGTIHDLGYKRYGGLRRGAGTRWRVIARHQITNAWKTWWRFKAVLGMAVITVAIAGGMMMFASDRKSGLGRAQFLAQRLIDTALPESIIWFCRVGFLASLTLAATVVASDVQSGAFTFYFARSTRPRHYVLGKLLGVAVLMACIVGAGPLVLAAVRLGVADSTDEVVALLDILPRTLAVAALATLTYAWVPLGFSALFANRRHALALWAAYYLIVGQMAYLLAHVTDPALGALDLPRAVQAVAFSLFDLAPRSGDPAIPVAAALGSLAGHVAIAGAVMALQVHRAHRAGIGASS